jgi:hypothetical protein
MFAGEPQAALQAAESELQIAEKFQLPLIVGQAAFQVGWAQFRLGEREAGLRGMEEAISAIRRTGAEMGLPYLMGLYAEALGDSGRLDGARKSVEAAIDLGRYNGTYFQLAEVLRIEARIREKSGADPTRSNRCSTRPRMSPPCSIPRSVGCALRWSSPAVFESTEIRTKRVSSLRSTATSSPSSATARTRARRVSSPNKQGWRRIFPTRSRRCDPDRQNPLSPTSSINRGVVERIGVPAAAASPCRLAQ